MLNLSPRRTHVKKLLLSQKRIVLRSSASLDPGEKHTKLSKFRPLSLTPAPGPLTGVLLHCY